MSDRSHWKPLESLVGERAKFFMYMGKHDGLHLYKHSSTRRYLNIDDKGMCYAYNGVSDRYEPIHYEKAIEHAFS